MLTTEALVTNFDAKDENKRAVVGSIRYPRLNCSWPL